MQDVADVDIVKMVWRARSVRDNLDCFELLRTKQQPMIAMCMGEHGLMSRVLSPKFGGFGVYGSVEGHEATAPNQPTIEKLNGLFRFKDINADTKLFGVIGSHVLQSSGPAFHNAAFEVADMNAVYLPIPIPAEWEHFKATFLELFHCEHLSFAGASITLPHKTHMLKLLDELHGSADGIVVVGEIGGDAEEVLAQKIIDENFEKPVVAYIAGRKAPKEKRMGHAGAIVMGNYGSAESKITMFSKANIPVAKKPVELPILLAGKMEKK